MRCDCGAADIPLCERISRVDLESLAPGGTPMPVVPPEDTAFVAAAIGGAWQDSLERSVARETPEYDPYDAPARHWELDQDGQPTQKIINTPPNQNLPAICAT